MDVSYIPIAKARGFTTHLDKVTGSLYKQNQAHEMLGCLLKSLTTVQLVIISQQVNYSTVVRLSQAVALTFFIAACYDRISDRVAETREDCIPKEALARVSFFRISDDSRFMLHGSSGSYFLPRCGNTQPIIQDEI